ncbi:MAG: fused MFS/spermidine synthase [Patescibacteria group bacterium]|nr:fused MFS/spermidine synthase [Patescibacteria group bacterium]
MEESKKYQNLYIIIALALSAASALIYEVVATHVLFYYFIESSYSISTVLSIFMLGLGIGSYIIYKILLKIENKEIYFGLLQICIGIYAFVVLSRLEQIMPRISDWGIFGVSVFVLLLPTIFLGAIFPLAATMFKKNQKDITGFVYSSDLAGAIFGSVIAGFILIPREGHSFTVLFGVLLNFLSAILIFMRLKSKKIALIPLVLILILIFLLMKDHLSFLNKTKSRQSNMGAQYFSDSPYGPVLVENKILYINKKIMCSMDYPDNTSEKMMVSYAIEPLKKKDAKTLNIGLGCGLTLKQLLSETSKTVDVVEINPKVVEANKTMTDVLQNKRVNLIIDDGLKYLRERSLEYDTILVDIEDPTVAHSSGLYTVEAFKTESKSLNDNGILAFWNFSAIKGRYADILFYSLKEAFPYVYNYPDVFVASKKELDKEEYSPQTPYEINTLNKNTLTDAFLQRKADEIGN